MKNSLLSLIFLILLCVSTPVFAENDVSLSIDVETAVEMALNANLGLQSTRIDTEVARRDYMYRFNVFMPSISARGTLGRANTEPTASMFNPDPQRWSFSAGVTASLTLSAQILQGVKAISNAYRDARITLQDAEREMRMQTRTSYYQVLLLQEQYELATRRLAAAEERLEEIQANYDAGLVDELTLLRTRVGVETQRPGVLAQKQAVDSAMRSFAASIGIDNPELLQLTGTIESSIVELQQASALLPLLEQNADLQALQRVQESLQIAINTTKAGMLPMITFSFSILPTLSGDPLSGDIFDPDSYSDSGSFSITVTQPVDAFIPGSSTYQDIANQQDALEQTRLQEKELLDALELQLIQLTQTIATERQTLESLSSNVELAEQAFLLAEEAYLNGLRDYSIVRDAEIDLDDARIQLLQEKHTYITNLLNLEYLLNTPIDSLKENQ